jgi:O-antigen ligase
MSVTVRIGRDSSNVIPVAAVAVGAAVAGAAGVVLVPEGLLLLVALALAAVGLAYPVVGLSVMLAGSTAMLISDAWQLPLVAGALATPLLVLDARRERSQYGIGTPRLLGGLVVYLMASWLIAANLQGGSFEPLHLAVLWGVQLSPLLLAFVLTRPMDDLTKLLWVFVGVAVALAMTQLLLPVPREGVVLGSGDLSALLAGSRNAIGVVYLLAICVTLPRIHLPPGPKDFALIALTIVLTLALAGGLSRASYVGGAALAATFLLIRGSRAGAITLLVIVIGLPFVLGGEVTTFDEALRRVLTTFDSGTLDTSSGARLDLWAAALRAFEQNPVFGVGYQQFSNHLPELWEGTVSDLAIGSRAGDYAYAHNLYLTVLSQGGLVGGIIFGALAASLVRDAARGQGAFRESAWLALAAAASASLFGEPVLVMAVALPFLVINAAARMSAEHDD